MSVAMLCMQAPDMDCAAILADPVGIMDCDAIHVV